MRFIISVVLLFLFVSCALATPQSNQLHDSMVAMSQLRGASKAELMELHAHVKKLAAPHYQLQAATTQAPNVLCETLTVLGVSSQCCLNVVNAANAAATQCAQVATVLENTLTNLNAASNFVGSACAAVNAVESCINGYQSIATSVSACVPSTLLGDIESTITTIVGANLNSEVAAIQTITSMLQGVLCKTDAANPGTYCLANLLNTTAVQALAADLEAKNLKQFVADLQADTPFFAATCSSCAKDILAIVQAFPSFGNPYIALISVALNGLELVCQQDPSNPGSSCLAQLESLLPYIFPTQLGTTTTTVSNTATPAPIPAAIKAAICSPCTQALTQLLEQLFPAEATVIASFAQLAFGLCVTDKAGNQCIVTLENAATSFVNQAQNGQLNGCIQQLTAGTPVCNSTCAALFNTDLFQPLGCCLGTLGLNSFTQAFNLGFVSVTSANLPGAALQVVAAAAAAQCNLQLPAQCTGFTNITVSLNIPNLSFVFATTGTNWNTIAQKIAADVSQALGVPAGTVTVSAPTVFQGTGVTVSIGVSLNPTSANAIAQALLSKLQNAQFPLPQTASYANANSGAAVSQSTAILAVSGSVNGVSTTSTSNAAALKASFFTFAPLFAIVYALFL